MSAIRPWRQQLKFDPLPPLLASGDEALVYFARRDLLENDAGPIQRLWQLPGAQKILKKQLPDGSWPWKGAGQHPAINHRLVETWRQLRFLVEQYGLTRDHPAIHSAAEYLFSCQSAAGDFRGILANQYATYYTGAILAVLVQAGYTDDARIHRCFEWLLSMRQSDGGWTIPLLTHKLDRQTQYRLTSEFAEPLEPDRSRPFSHNWTGMILRAFPLHPFYRKCEAAIIAAGLLKSRFFQADVYTSYQSPGYWVRFEYPFRWNNLVAALDSLSRIGLSKDDEHIRLAADWLVDHQQRTGLWKLTYAKAEQKETKKSQAMQPWVTLAICRVFKRLYG